MTGWNRCVDPVKKKLMILGGSRYAVPVVEAVHCFGVHVITADYLPDNSARGISWKRE